MWAFLKIDDQMHAETDYGVFECPSDIAQLAEVTPMRDGWPNKDTDGGTLLVGWFKRFQALKAQEYMS